MKSVKFSKFPNSKTAKSQNSHCTKTNTLDWSFRLISNSQLIKFYPILTNQMASNTNEEGNTTEQVENDATNEQQTGEEQPAEDQTGGDDAGAGANEGGD